ncbi:hypothetical protein BBO99_00006582 [Phytophthora kernoviae]|uniref:Uncharacterized protein n=2 Tax=Phytophthora kernoviae TaxID=325452 RepID=A0A3R7J6J9_9STRA|nr:hypothetical protein G195_010219 [Phytophthora kernoviae 00238/432]KAG2513558.1 hypothetical protein JM18_008450 [Phytophthora kernoviae]KAG2515064.1 hypothetical protein JM16_006378 [Phytophthora kernoviae]RLN10760.1 hypothetical protein BBI17_006606 [Phytophthora kernoviae]RLN77664.1 hypothetical protein BBO99_00006582 [Phytophthora kernoviae]
MDMASLDLFAQKRRRRTDLSMSRIIEVLADKESADVSAVRPNVIPQQLTVSATLDFQNNVGFKSDQPEPEQVVAVKPTKLKLKKTQPAASSSSDVTKFPKRRRARTGFAPLTESEKRVKQRLLVKRSYYRKIDTLMELRSEMEELESKCREVIISRRQLQSPPLSTSLKEEKQRCEKIREQYTQLAISQDDLRHENEQLRAEAMEQSKARTRVGILLDEEMRDQKEARDNGSQLGLAPWSSAAQQSENPAGSTENSNEEDKLKPVLDFIPLTEDECITIVREAYADVRLFCDKQHYESTGASVFGWRDRRQVDGDTLRFFLEKTFENHTAAEISSRMWDLVSSEHGVNRIYASDVAIDFHLVQRVNDENVLFYRTIEPEGVNMVLKTLVLASRVQIDDHGSFMVLFRSVDPVARGIVKKDGPDTGFSTEKKEVWSDVFSWGLYEAVGDQQQHCRNFFGGFVSSLLTQRSLEFWLMHVLLIAVRCESEVIGPLFILP